MDPRTLRRTVATTLLLAIGTSCPALASPAPLFLRASVQSDVTSQFERGALVKLRSGELAMTVSAVKAARLNGVWTDDTDQVNDATFPAIVLQRF